MRIFIIIFYLLTSNYSFAVNSCSKIFSGSQIKIEKLAKLKALMRSKDISPALKETLRADFLRIRRELDREGLDNIDMKISESDGLIQEKIREQAEIERKISDKNREAMADSLKYDEVYNYLRNNFIYNNEARSIEFSISPYIRENIKVVDQVLMDLAHKKEVEYYRGIPRFLVPIEGLYDPSAIIKVLVQSNDKFTIRSLFGDTFRSSKMWGQYREEIVTLIDKAEPNELQLLISTTFVGKRELSDYPEFLDHLLVRIERDKLVWIKKYFNDYILKSPAINADQQFWKSYKDRLDNINI